MYLFEIYSTGQYISRAIDLHEPFGNCVGLLVLTQKHFFYHVAQQDPPSDPR